MARVEASVQTVVRAGVTPAYDTIVTGAGNGLAFDNDPAGRIVHIKNSSGGPGVVTFEVPKTVDGLQVPDLTVTVPDGEERFVGPFPKALYNQAEGDTGLSDAVVIECDAAVDVAVLEPGSLAY